MNDNTQPVRILNMFTIMDRGGAETMVMNYYRHIDRTKVQFDFMVHREQRGAYDDEIEALGGRIFRMMPIRPWSSGAYRRMLRAFFAEHPEYKIIHSHMSELGLYAFMEAEKAGVPVRICHAHNRPYGVDLKSFPRWYMKTRMKPHITHRFMCGIESGRWLFGDKYEPEFIMLNNAIAASDYRFDPQRREAVRASLGLSDEVTIGHVGRFNYQKNHPFLIDTFAALHKKQPNSVLLLVGAGEGRSDMEEKVKSLGLTDSVRFLGVRSDVADLLQAMDVFAFPSFFEGLSVASVEAQASGIPVLISDRVPIECKKSDVLFVQSLDSGAEAWADRLLELAAQGHSDTYDQIVRNRFDIDENARWLENFYLTAAQGE